MKLVCKIKTLPRRTVRFQVELEVLASLMETPFSEDQRSQMVRVQISLLQLNRDIW
jgi:hypothetical protein